MIAKVNYVPYKLFRDDSCDKHRHLEYSLGMVDGAL